MGRCRGRARALLFASAILGSLPAHADSQPWKAGVSQAQQDRAKVLLDEGNALFAEDKVVDALAKYRAALAEWNHPAIHFNVVRCLIQLDRVLEASEAIEQAMKYGAAPLNADVYREALNYQRLLAKQIGEIEISCTQPGVTLSLDGVQLPACPSTTSRRTLPGRHQVVGKQAGFLTQTVEVVVAGADRQRVAVTLVPLEGSARIVHRWPSWQPWLAFGGGLAIAGVGVLFQLDGISSMSDYDDLIRRECEVGCATPPDGADAKKQRAERSNAIGVTVMSVGAATAIAGGVMLYLNRGKTVYERSDRKVGILPLQGGAALTLRARF